MLTVFPLQFNAAVHALSNFVHFIFFQMPRPGKMEATRLVESAANFENRVRARFENRILYVVPVKLFSSISTRKKMYFRKSTLDNISRYLISSYLSLYPTSENCDCRYIRDNSPTH